MTYFILLTLISVIAIISFFSFKKDIMTPTFISCAIYAFSLFLAILGLNSWNNVKSLKIELIIVIVLGLLSFFIGEILARKIFSKINNQTKKEIKMKKNRKTNQTKKIEKVKVIKENNKVIKINIFIYILTICFILITMFFLVSEIKRICIFYDFNSNSISELLAFYRTKIGLFSTDLVKDNVDINFLVKQMKKTCDVLCVIWMYIFFNNKISKVGWKKDLLNIIPVILCMACTLLTSGRSLLMHMIVSFAMMYLITYYLNKKDNKLFKTFKIIGIFTIIALLLFYFILPLTGRNAKSNGFDYITFYLGTPIPSFNKSLDKDISNEYIGEDTFSGIYYSLNKLNIMDYKKPSTHEWTNFGVFNSNVYTSLRSYYNDFGIFGIIICQLVFGFIISLLYMRLKLKKESFTSILYSYYGYILIDQIRDEQFYNLLSTATVAYLLIIIVLYFVYIKNDYVINYLKNKFNVSKKNNI